MSRASQKAAVAETATKESIDDLDSILSGSSTEEVALEPAKAKPRTFQISADLLKVIAKSAIRMTKLDPAKRTFSKEFAEKLAVDIGRVGLLHPPIVMDNGDGSYDVKSGVHRIYACCKVLGWTTIPCFTFNRGEDDLAEAIEIATNLWVNPLSEPQSRAAIARWRELYMARTPAKTTTRGTAPKQDGFAKEVATVLGVSDGQAFRIANTAKVISPEDRTILEKAGVTQTSIDQIAELREPDAINVAVKLAAAGKDPAEAIREGKQVKVKVKKEKKATEAKPAKHAAEGDPIAAAPDEEKPEKIKASDMTDDQWLETHCSKILAVLPYKVAFRNDAILYRRIAEKIIGFRTGTKKALAELKKPGANGAFFSNVFRIVRTSHPMNWLLCAGCSGTGHVKDAPTEQCKKCFGGGYQVKYEET